MKARTKRRIAHLVTRKRLVSKRVSRHVMRSAAITVATASLIGLATSIAVTKPVISASAQGAPRIIVAAAKPTPEPGSSAVVQSGRGSWYALGLPQPDALTCASRTFPRGSYLSVKNIGNGLTVVCRVNDYGPAAYTNRVIDLSRGSFTQVASLSQGVITVEVSPVPQTVVEYLSLPIRNAFAASVGYDACVKNHEASYCDAHRQ